MTIPKPLVDWELIESAVVDLIPLDASLDVSDDGSLCVTMTWLEYPLDTGLSSSEQV